MRRAWKRCVVPIHGGSRLTTDEARGQPSKDPVSPRILFAICVRLRCAYLGYVLRV